MSPETEGPPPLTLAASNLAVMNQQERPFRSNDDQVLELFQRVRGVLLGLICEPRGLREGERLAARRDRPT